MRQLHQLRTANGQIFPSPRLGETMYETPPAFCWLKEDGVFLYRIAVRNAEGRIVYEGQTERNFLVPDFLLPSPYQRP